jgi:hypothetical protein
MGGNERTAEENQQGNQASVRWCYQTIALIGPTYEEGDQPAAKFFA